jgi:hypothetical protein
MIPVITCEISKQRADAKKFVASEGIRFLPPAHRYSNNILKKLGNLKKHEKGAKNTAGGHLPP